MSETASKLLGKGTPLELIDGRKVTVIFSIRVFALIEEKYGSLSAVDEIFIEGRRGKLITHMGQLLAWAIRGADLEPDEALDLIEAKDVALVTHLTYEALLAGFQLPQTTTTETSQPTAQATETTETDDSTGANTSSSGAPTSDNQEPISGT